MKNLIFLCLLLFPLMLNAQNWYQDGDQWVNSISSGYFGGVNGFEEITVKGDTLVGQQSYKVLESKFALNILGRDTLFEYREPYLMREQNDSVFHRYEGIDYLIYDFTMEVGDNILWYSNYNCPVTFRLDSIFEIEIDGVSLKVQEGFVDSDGYFYSRNIRIYERIGVVESRFNGDNFDWSELGFFIPRTGLTCLADDSPPTLCQFKSSDLALKDNSEVCYNISSSTQVWFKPEVQWVYTFGGDFSATTFARVLEYEWQNDTLINGDLFNRLTNKVATLVGDSELVYDEYEPYLVRSEDRKVYYWTGDTSHLVYDFNMSVGDTLDWNPDLFEGEETENCRSYFVLDSIGIDYMNVLPMQVQHGRLYEDYWGSVSVVEIYESIGLVRSRDTSNNVWQSRHFLIPELDMGCYFCDCQGQGGFCSYTDEMRRTFPRDIDAAGCFDLVSASHTLSLDDVGLSIMENPVKNSITILGEMESNSKFQIYSMNGMLIKSGTIENANIDLQNLKTGSYFINVIQISKRPQTLKFIKI